MSKEEDVNQYIPKFISSKPWYGKETTEDDYLAHQRKDPNEIIDYSLPVTGSGIHDEFNNSGAKMNEDYVSKRDRWYGYDVEEWNHTLQNWNEIRARKRLNIMKLQKSSIIELEKLDSDDTDYELELIELNLDQSVLKSNSKEDTLEKTLRDRQDIPSYIYNITSNPDNKIRVEYDPKSRLSKNLEKGFLNNNQEFVRKLTGEGQGLTNLQKFSWDLNKEDQQKQNEKLMGLTIQEEEPVFNLDLSLEASPTLMQLKHRRFKEEQEKKRSLKRQALIGKYGSHKSEDSETTESGNQKLTSKPKSDTILRKLEQVEQVDPEKPNMHKMKPSQYTEDNVTLNHTSIYGSYYNNGKWGYQCCKQLEKDSECK